MVWVLSVGPFPNRTGEVSPHPALQWSVLGECMMAARVDVLVAGPADDDGLAAPFCHEVDPGRPVGPVVAVEVGEFADVVHFNLVPRVACSSRISA